MPRTRRYAVSLAAAALIAGLVTAAPAGASTSPKRAKGSFIVLLRSGVNPDSASASIARRHGGTVAYAYDSLIRGFAFHGPDSAAAALRRDPQVAAVEADFVARAVDVPPDGADHLETTRSNCTQSDVVATECQIGSSTRPTAYQSGYSGLGSTIGILDTGVRASHPYFQAHNNVVGHYGGCSGGSAKDQNGHGTATASNAAGRIGVAHEASIFSVKVFPGASSSTTWSMVICGLNYVRKYNANHPTSTIDVVNLSIAGPGERALRKAVERLINSGVVVTAAAGNDNGGAVQAPAAYANVISVGAMSHNGNGIASFSAHGADIATPGVSIFSASLNGGGDSTRSGTSRSSPQVAGAAAVVLALGAAPSDVKHDLVSTGVCPAGGHNAPCSGNWTGGDNEPRLDTYCAATLAAGLTDPTWCA
jgi:subtilisin family serine protease